MKTWKELANPWVGGLGVYEPGRPIEEVARELGLAEDAQLIKLASNENALGPSPRAVKAMAAAASGMHRYPDGGTYGLRRALAARFGLEPEQVLPGNGSNELIELIARVFLGVGSDVVIADRAFVVYRLAAAACRADAVAVPMTDLRHDLDAMAAAVRASTRVMFIANPNNPTGTAVGAEAIDRFMDTVPEDVVVCFDEAYIEMLPPAQRPDTLRYVREGRRAIVLRTFSKAYGLAGLRIGYALAPAPAVELLNRVRQPFNVNAMAQAAALAALEDEAHVDRTREMVLEGLAWLERELARLKLRCVPSVANFMLVNVWRGREVFEALQREGVIVRPMDGYGLPEYVRITVGLPEENRRCVRTLARVLELPA